MLYTYGYIGMTSDSARIHTRLSSEMTRHFRRFDLAKHEIKLKK